LQQPAKEFPRVLSSMAKPIEQECVQKGCTLRAFRQESIALEMFRFFR
jgi:hypothetical protein